VAVANDHSSEYHASATGDLRRMLCIAEDADQFLYAKIYSEVSNGSLAEDEGVHLWVRTC
jgi:hypothetical protein